MEAGIPSAARLTSGPGAGIPFERIRRITGYLVGTMEKWNNAKRAEEHERVKHGLTGADSKRKGEHHGKD